ncbi:DNA-processing protein DprA (plasmid) [Bacillus sp. JZ8]
MIKQLLTLYFLGLTKKTISYIIRKFSVEEWEKLLEGHALELQFKHNIFEDKEISTLLTKKKLSEAIRKAEEQINYCDANDIQIISAFEDIFPDKLFKVENPPLFLFAKGNVALINSEFNIACVGTRNPSYKAKRRVEEFVKGLVEEGFVIVSGLAYGIDAESHRACLKNRGKTIAVLANGLDKVYPHKHAKLADEIIETGGLLLSEYPIFSTPYKMNFVQRNRVITGVSEGVIVFEASENSGTMHSARFAYKQKKKIFCPLDTREELSGGVKQLLITNSAIAVNDYKEIIRAFHNENKNIIKSLELDRKAFTFVEKYAQESGLTIQEIINKLLIEFSDELQKGKRHE